MQRLDFETLRHVFSYLSYRESFKIHTTGSKIMRDPKLLHQTTGMTTRDAQHVKRTMLGVTSILALKNCGLFDFQFFPNLTHFKDHGVMFKETSPRVTDLSAFPSGMESMMLRCDIDKLSVFSRFSDLREVRFKNCFNYDCSLPTLKTLIHIGDPARLNLSLHFPILEDIQSTKMQVNCTDLPSSLISLGVEQLDESENLSRCCPNLTTMRVNVFNVDKLTIPSTLRSILFVVTRNITREEIDKITLISKLDNVNSYILDIFMCEEHKKMLPNAKILRVSMPISYMRLCEKAESLAIAVPHMWETYEHRMETYAITQFPSYLTSLSLTVYKFRISTLQLLPDGIKNVRVDAYIIHENCDISDKTKLWSLHISGGPCNVVVNDYIKLPSSLRHYDNNTVILNEKSFPMPNLEVLRIRVDHDFNLWYLLPTTISEFGIGRYGKLNHKFNLITGNHWSPIKLIKLKLNAPLDKEGLAYADNHLVEQNDE